MQASNHAFEAHADTEQSQATHSSLEMLQLAAVDRPYREVPYVAERSSKGKRRSVNEPSVIQTAPQASLFRELVGFLCS
jgi:hypothetical protein